MDGGSGSVSGARNYRGCLQVALAALLNEAGFDSVDRMAMESLTEMASSILNEIGRSGKGYCELACRAQPMGADVVLALSEMGLVTGMDGRRTTPQGIVSAGIKGLREYAMRSGRKSLGTPQVSQPTKPANMLHTGDNRKDGRGKSNAVIPDYLPKFPDSHSYIRTPTHRQPEHDYESVREKAATQKRDVERALTRFMAKTCGRTHSLFNTDDTNLYPLISCDPKATRSAAAAAGGNANPFHQGGGGSGQGPGGSDGGPDGSGRGDPGVLPAYVTALMFRDQLFEEDESEYLPKKKAEEDEEEEEGLEGDEEQGEESTKEKKPKTELDESDDEGGESAAKKVKLEAGAKPGEGSSKEATKQSTSASNSTKTDNPFLRTTRTPRNVLPGAQMARRMV